MNTARMERAGRRAKAGSLSGLSGGLPSGLSSGLPSGASVRRQRSLEWSGDRYSSSDDDRPSQPPLADRVFAELLAQATQQFDNEQRRIYGSQAGEETRYVSSPQRQSSPFPHESTNRRFYRRNRNSKGEEIFNGETGGTLSRRTRRAEDFTHDNNARNARLCLNNGTSGSGAQSERECESPPEPAPPEVPPRGPSLHVTLRHRPAPCDAPAEPDRLYLSEEFVMSEGGHGGSGAYPARSPMSSSTTGHSSSSHHRFGMIIYHNKPIIYHPYAYHKPCFAENEKLRPQLQVPASLLKCPLLDRGIM
ncbi:uncharacterized protein LOC126366442 [Pectinophora gossypiella]|uniref:uncharacterized protein LOC126366442 n=1 Tax=Pectinophora gossypiella TaxID=13191 RepID=UPI00214EEC2D|nr:uncharacterized protein LOC126366442 [Pectinophora gossypiella]